MLAFMTAIEAALAQAAVFEILRPDELGRVATRFTSTRLSQGELHHIGVLPGDARMVLVVRGRVELSVVTSAGVLRSILDPGDHYGELLLLAGLPCGGRLLALEPAEVALLDRQGLEALLAEFPALALPLSRRLASELRARNDLLRQLLDLHAARLEPIELEAALEARRRSVSRRGARVARRPVRALFSHLVVRAGRELGFWVMGGFLGALLVARLLVWAITAFGLEQQFFLLVTGPDPNPMHVHHFIYGLALAALAGFGALLPVGRKVLRLLAVLVGVGAGLIFDEFALLWNLNPDYSQASSLIASGIVGTLLIQMVYFRRFWAAMARRLTSAMRGAR